MCTMPVALLPGSCRQHCQCFWWWAGAVPSLTVHRIQCICILDKCTECETLSQAADAKLTNPACALCLYETSRTCCAWGNRDLFCKTANHEDCLYLCMHAGLTRAASFGIGISKFYYIPHLENKVLGCELQANKANS